MEGRDGAHRRLKGDGQAASKETHKPQALITLRSDLVVTLHRQPRTLLLPSTIFSFACGGRCCDVRADLLAGSGPSWLSNPTLSPLCRVSNSSGSRLRVDRTAGPAFSL